jgi:hypothetical protein
MATLGAVTEPAPIAVAKAMASPLVVAAPSPVILKLLNGILAVMVV